MLLFYCSSALSFVREEQSRVFILYILWLEFFIKIAKFRKIICKWIQLIWFNFKTNRMSQAYLLWNSSTLIVNKIYSFKIRNKQDSFLLNLQHDSPSHRLQNITSNSRSWTIMFSVLFMSLDSYCGNSKDHVTLRDFHHGKFSVMQVSKCKL